MIHELLVYIGLAAATLSPPPGAKIVELKTLDPPYDPSYLLGGQFGFLGSAGKGSSTFDGWPPEGVVKVYYSSQTTVGFFRVPPDKFTEFERAWDRFEWSPVDYQETAGTYPIARSVDYCSATHERPPCFVGK